MYIVVFWELVRDRLGVGLEKGWEWEITKKHEETFGSEVYFHYLDYGNEFTGVYMSKHIMLCALNMCSLFCHLYLNNAVKFL